MRCLRVVPYALLAALLAACSNEPLTPMEEMLTASFNMGGTDRPFYAELEGLATFGPDLEGRCPSPNFGIITYTTGSGKATHLGNLQHTSSHCPGPYIGDPPPYGTMLGGEWTFMAANGDELYAQYEGLQLTPLFENPTLVTSEVTFIGGTGRFSDASGWAHADGYIQVPANPDTDPWPVYLNLEGRISY